MKLYHTFLTRLIYTLQEIIIKTVHQIGTDPPYYASLTKSEQAHLMVDLWTYHFFCFVNH